MRTKGIIVRDGLFLGIGNINGLTTIASTDFPALWGGKQEAEDNAIHFHACWNAFEENGIVDRMKEFIKSFPMDRIDGWWCPQCKQIIDGCHVTYEECCEYCGTYLADKQPSESWIEEAQALLAELAEAGK